MRDVRLLVLGGVMALGLLGGCGSSGGSGGDPGAPSSAAAFRDQYCALINPCCAQGGYTTGCAGVVNAAAQAGTYDATAGAACLADLRARQPNADFCASFGTAYAPGLPSVWAPAVPACSPVFMAHGTVPVGQPCSQDSDCAVAPNGATRCMVSFGGPSGTDITMACTELVGVAAGDPCDGTSSNELGLISWVGNVVPSVSNICDHAKNLHCDSQTLTCAATPGDGVSCSEIFDCGATSFCDFAEGGFCAPRLATGATCSDAFGACDGGASCNRTSLTCVAPLGAGAACTTVLGEVSPCASGQCSNGKCTSVLPQLCGF